MRDHEKECEADTGLVYGRAWIHANEYIQWLQSQLHARDEEAELLGDENKFLRENQIAMCNKLDSVIERLKAERECPKEGCEHWIRNRCDRWLNTGERCMRDANDHFKPKEVK